MKPNSTMWARFFHARLAWVSMTPLGWPVVPDVYIRRWTSSPAVAAGARSPGVDAEVGEGRPPLGRRLRHARPQERGLQALRRLVGEADERLVAHERPRLGVLEDVAHLGRGEPPVDRHGDGAEVVGGEERLEELGAVVREQADDVAAPDAALGSPPASAAARVGHLAVGGGLALEHRHRLVGRAGRVVGEHGEPVHVRLLVVLCDRHERDLPLLPIASFVPTSHPIYLCATCRPVACPHAAGGCDRRLSTQPQVAGPPRGDRRHVGPRSSPGRATTPPASTSCATPTTSARARSTTTSARRRGCSPPSTTG